MKLDKDYNAGLEKFNIDFRGKCCIYITVLWHCRIALVFSCVVDAVPARPSLAFQDRRTRLNMFLVRSYRNMLKRTSGLLWGKESLLLAGCFWRLFHAITGLQAMVFCMFHGMKVFSIRAIEVFYAAQTRGQRQSGHGNGIQVPRGTPPLPFCGGASTAKYSSPILK